MGAIVTGIVFLLAGAGVYAFNTESHTTKLVFGRLGLSLGEVETVAVLLGLGLFFLGLGGLQYLAANKDLDPENDGMDASP